MKHRVEVVAVFALLAGPLSQAHAQPRVRVLPIPADASYGIGTAINARGDAVGVAVYRNSSASMFWPAGGGVVAFEEPENNGGLWDINSSGTAVGINLNSGTTFFAASANGSWARLALDGSFWWDGPVHIDDAGRLAAVSREPSDWTRVASVWSSGGGLLRAPLIEPPFEDVVMGMTRGGVVFGSRSRGDPMTGFVWRPSSGDFLTIAVPGAVRTWISAANDVGEAAGWAEGVDGLEVFAAPFVWSAGAGVRFLRPDAPLGSDGLVWSMNARGVIVGEVWDPAIGGPTLWLPTGREVRLRDLLAASLPPGLVIGEPTEVTDSGLILMDGWVETEPGSYRGQPVVVELCPSDYTFDGRTDVRDLLAYLGDYRRGEQFANLVQPAESGVGVDDLLAFLAAYRAGC